MLEKIQNCYDSHTHFWATGQVAEGLKLHFLESPQDLHKLKINSAHYRGRWLVGFGWNQNNWIDKKFPNKFDLDKFYSSTPVFFSRVDGHASWVNSAGLSELALRGFDFSKNPTGGSIERDSNGEPTGILLDQAHIKAMMLLPDFSEAQHLDFFKSSQKIFNKSGFTHIRDLSMNLNAWNLLRQLEDKKSLTLCVDAFITVENLGQLSSVLKDIELIRIDHSEQMRLHGVKIFIDGSLGSKTAALTENYRDSSDKGLLIWTHEEIKILLSEVWRRGLDVAIHCIGDQAALLAVTAAREVAADRILGRLHLEHVQLLAPDIVQLMKPLHVTCYLQPCHWLSDESWLKNILPETLVKKLFQWELLRKNKIPFHFGSDSPIERPSIFDTRKALLESATWGVPALATDWRFYHQHPDLNWCPSVTEYNYQEIKQVYFKGEALL